MAILKIRYALALLAVAIGLSLSACGDKNPGVPEPNASVEDHFFDNFRTAVADAGRDGYAPYWLGRTFEVEGVTFTGPSVTDLFHGIAGGGVDLEYVGHLGRRGSVGLDITEYSAAAWALVADVHNRPGGEDVVIAGHAGRLFEMPPQGPVPGSLQLIVEFNGTTLLIRTSGSVVALGTPEPNPLADRATFLATMEQLRPYPE